MQADDGSLSFDADFKRFLDEIDGESDRAAVILSAAQLDLILHQMLQRALIPAPTGDDELLDGDGPLSSFSAKISLAHRLGLIDSAFARALHLVRKIRNAFAHEAIGCTLESGAHRERVRELAAPFHSMQGFDDLVRDVTAGRSGPKNEFRMAVSFMVVLLRHAPSRVEPPSPAATIELLPEVLRGYRFEKLK